MQELKFIAKIEKYTGIKGTGKNSVESFQTNKKEISQKQAEAYLKKTNGAMAFIGPATKPFLEIWPTLDGTYAIEISSEEKAKPRIIIKESFDDVIKYIQNKVKDTKITIKIESYVNNPTEWAKKYKYKVDKI
jgi:hypothetical protein